MTTSLVTNALAMAVERRGRAKGLVHHSDRGSQYASEAYQRMLAVNGITGSMSRRGNCYDNAAMESFFHTLKVECVFEQRYESRREAKADIFDWIEMFYNRQRRHSTLGYISPVEFELHKAA